MDIIGKLVELLTEFYGCDPMYYDVDALAIVQHLISNGVTVQERGHWVSYESAEPYGCTDDKEWYRCSKCGKDADGRCYEDEWYSAPILSTYCPHCGAKMDA